MKVNFDAVNNEIKHAKDPMVTFTQFINLLIEHYKHFTNCKWGWVLYDWLNERGHLNGISFANPGKTNAEKALMMDKLVSQQAINLNHIQTIIKQ